MGIEDKSRYVNDAVELLKELIATPRASRNETEAADVMEQRMAQWGLNPQREANNLWVTAPGFEAGGGSDYAVSVRDRITSFLRCR